MAKVFLLLLVTTALVTGGCCNKPSGSREFIPGKGWVPTE